MEFQYRDGKPILPVQISGNAEKISLIGILDSGADYCTAPRAICEELLDTVREQEIFIPGGNEVDEISKRYLVKENILFVDPLTAMMKPQSQLDLSAIRKVMGIV